MGRSWTMATRMMPRKSWGVTVRRGRSEAGSVHLYLLGDTAYVHLGAEPPMAGAWPDDPDEG